VSQTIIEPLRSRPRTVGGTWCDECGYSRRGLPPELACPECGHLPAAAFAIDVRPHLAWSRSVFIGLVLLIVIPLQAVTTVLVQPFNTDVGGTAPALNLPGPKLWAVPLLQRPVGRAPAMPGIVGTRAAMVSLLAIWLITAPCPSPRAGEQQLLRLATRWGSVTLFGLAFGTLMASQGLWPSELPPFRQALVAAVELPATALLYWYLRRLASQVPGRERRSALDKLVWWVPAVILGGAGMLAVQWWMTQVRAAARPPQNLVLTIAAVYGAAAMLVGVMATATVGGLAGTYARLAFPSASLVLRSSVGWTRRVRATMDRMGGERGRSLLVAAGLVLLLVVMLLGNDTVLWIADRGGIAGSLPFVNYPGPKMWPSTGTIAMRLARDWDPLVANSTLITLNLLAVWLVTMRIGQRSSRRLRAITRGLAVVTIGAAVAFTGTYPAIDWNGPSSTANKVFFAVTLLSELPVTILLYIVMARLSEEHDRPPLAAKFRLLALLIVALVSTSLLGFVVSKYMPELRGTGKMLAITSAYGAATFAAAAWAWACVLRLSAVLIRGTSLQSPHAPGS
jgi:hypothetical protein